MTSRRAFLLLAAGSLAAACGRDDDVPMETTLMPAPPGEEVTPGRLKTVAQWTAVFEQSWDYLGRTGLPLSRSADSWDHYNLSYAVDGCVAMFQATGEQRYLDRALTFVENVAASATPSSSLPHSTFHDRFRGWGSSTTGEGGDEVPLFESYFWRYGTALLVAMRDANVHPDRYRKLLAFAEGDVFDKWYSRGPDDTVYRERTHMTAHWALIALNLAAVTADPARRTRYLEVAGRIDRRLRGQLRRNPVEPTAYFWSDRWGSTARPGQDVSHGNGVMAYVVEGRNRGDFWTDADMAGFCALLGVIWPGDQTYRGFVDGSGTDNGWLSDGFVKLGRFDPAVQLRLDGYPVVNDQFAANMALNARFLGQKGSGR